MLINCVAGPKECEDIIATDDGAYTIYPKSCDEPVLAYCIIEQNKKWTVSIDYFYIINEKKKKLFQTHVSTTMTLFVIHTQIPNLEHTTRF